MSRIVSMVLLAGALALTGCGEVGGATPLVSLAIHYALLKPRHRRRHCRNYRPPPSTATRSQTDVTSEVAWSSSNTATATIGAATGKALGVAAGTVALTATLARD